MSGQKKCKVETTASMLQRPGSCRPGPGSSQAGGQKWCRDIKKESLVKREPLAPQNTVTMDDEVCCLLACNAVVLHGIVAVFEYSNSLSFAGFFSCFFVHACLCRTCC